ncbi:glycosyltransferase [Halobacillus litoralis]|uniref:4,4'-diaponeurosporenoate glycosyltransferase n=1 Tax=Halobacillus litoralis TaxID=45668 RepID=A0A845DR84_9BACI|nr:glycosyltransferase family 2 protein [Halobacillus litoralis]MYL19688.1 glycosyltransferase [Halobacillus litoralis]MYL37085.1 glycosyltransferase [Halobacillus litoralis]
MLFWIYLLTTVVWMVFLIDFMTGIRKIPSLSSAGLSDSEEYISVIIAAKDEETTITQTLESLIHQTKSPDEIIVVNDRSGDRTGALINEAAACHPQIVPVHVTELPEGWLGKNHALYLGSSKAAGDYLLFTDADIHFHGDTLRYAMKLMEKHKLDYLTAAPDLQARSLLLKGLISFFLFGFSYLKRPWTANDPSSNKGMGIGAFQLIRTKAYQHMGGHEKMKMRADDDLALGQRMKEGRFSQMFVSAKQHLSVEWYPNLSSALRGFEKNAFAGLNYSFLLSISALFGVFVSQILPFFLLFHSDPSVQIISFINVLLLFCLYILSTRAFTTYPLWLAAALPVSAALFLFMLARALILTWLRGGIEWRGNRYSLRELKQDFRDTKEDSD